MSFHPIDSSHHLSQVPSLNRFAGQREGHMLNILHDVGSLAMLFFSSTIFFQGSIVGAFVPGAFSVIQGFMLAKTMVNNQDRGELLNDLDRIMKPAILIQYMASLFFITATFTGTAIGGTIMTSSFATIGALSYFFADRIFSLIDDQL